MHGVLIEEKINFSLFSPMLHAKHQWMIQENNLMDLYECIYNLRRRVYKALFGL
jgi:hypothetical protein